MIEINKIHQADTFAVLHRIEDDSLDLVVCDGPYGVTVNEWDRMDGIQEFNLKLVKLFSSKMKMGASLHLFGKPDCIDFIDYRPFLSLKRKIVWYQPGRLAQGRTNYTNNCDVICYFVKGNKARAFNPDDIRIPQLVELSHRQRCEQVPSVTNGRFGKTRFNGNGKNPGGCLGRYQATHLQIKGTCESRYSERAW